MEEKNKYKERLLLLTVFTTGALVMVLELLGSRIASPFIGASMVTWTSLIGVVLGFLSLGYYLGGEWAMNKPDFAKLSLLILIAGSWVLVIALFKDVILSFVMGASDSQQGKAVMASILLLGIPSVFLGAVSPYVVKLSLTDLNTSSEVVGRLYAVSTLGSIAGTFATGFWLVPMLGSLKLLYLVMVLLVGLSLLLSFDRKEIKILLIVVGVWGMVSGLSLPSFGGGLVLDRDTSFSRVWVDEVEATGGAKMRRMFIDGALSSSVVMGKDEILVFPYYHYYDLMFWHKGDLKEVLMLGGAGLGYPRYSALKYPGIKMTVVEIDEGLSQIAKEAFGYKDNERISLVHEDARVFLNQDIKKYDAILIDVFSSYTMPFHLVTKEALGLLKERLTDDGVVIVNVISAREGKNAQIYKSVFATYKTAFPYVNAYSPTNSKGADQVQNVVLVASKKELKDPIGIAEETKKLLTNRVAEPEKGRVLTDDWAPVDYWTGVMMARR